MDVEGRSSVNLAPAIFEFACRFAPLHRLPDDSFALVREARHPRATVGVVELY